MKPHVCSRYWPTLGILVLQAALTPAQTAEIEITPPANGTWIQDGAGMLSSADIRRVSDICSDLDHELNRPFYVVTIESMAAHGHAGTSVERFARKLYEQWGADPDFASGKNWRGGILLLISKGDRKARIELGANWGGNYDGQCRQIMDWAIVPAFKRGDFSGGIVAGVTGLDRMARDADTPAAAASQPNAPPVPATPASARRAATPAPNSVQIPANPPVTRPVHIRPQPVTHIVNQGVRGPGFGGGLPIIFLFFFLAVPVLGVIGLLRGGSGRTRGSISRHRFTNCDDDWTSPGFSNFHHHDHGSFGSHGGSGMGNHGHSGGGGGASGSW